MKFTGTVISGRGKATSRIAACENTLFTLLGAVPVHGTLNVILRRPITFNLEQATISADRRRMFWPLTLNGLSCLAYRWKTCPLHVIEVVSHLPLRSHLKLTDGAVVRLQSDSAFAVSVRTYLYWAALWRWRESRYYTSEKHVAWVKSMPRWQIHAIQGDSRLLSQASPTAHLSKDKP